MSEAGICGTKVHKKEQTDYCGVENYPKRVCQFTKVDRLKSKSYSSDM